MRTNGIHTGLLSALGALLVLAAACTPARHQSDDDDAVDDDSSLPDDDDVLVDDDDAGDDDAGDDDAGDDDAGDDDDALVPGTSSVQGHWFFSYTVDSDGDGQGDVDLCQQDYEFTATIGFGPNAVGATCPPCSGEMQTTNVVDVTSGSTEIDTPCVPATHFGDQEDMGEILTDPSTGMADFIHPQGLIDIGTLLAQAPGPMSAIDPSLTPAYLAGIYADADVQLTHVGYITDVAGGFFETVGDGGLAAVAVAPAGVEGFLPFFTYYNAPGGPRFGMDGQYGVSALWSISWSGGSHYTTINFSGMLEASFVPAP